MSTPTTLPAHLQAIQSLLDDCSPADLSLINAYIVEHAKAQQARSRAELMARFKPGDRVLFEDKEGTPVRALVIKTNKQTVSLRGDDDKKWNVSPELLTLVQEPARSREAPRQLSLVQDSPSANAALPSIGQRREWVGGLIDAPGYITDESGDSSRPQIHVWINENALVVGMTLITPSDPDLNIVEALRKAIDTPLAGTPGAPSHIRVNDKRQASKLQAAFPSIHCVCGATPELFELQTTMHNDMASSGESHSLYESGASTEAIGEFFEAAAQLYRTKPWDILSSDQHLISVTIDSFALKEAPLSFIGQASQSFGFLLFEQLAHYDQFTALGDAMLTGEMVDLPPHTSLSYDPARDVPSAIRKKISSRGWTVANTKAYPFLMALDEGRGLRPLTPRDITLHTALSKALAGALSSKQVKLAITSGIPVKLEETIQTEAGPVKVSLETPFPFESVMQANGAVDSLFARLLVMDLTQEELDWDLHDQLSTELERHYQASPEARALDLDVSISSLIMSFAINYQDCTIATLTPGELEEILYELIPRKVMLPASSAADMITDARAFFSFLKRAYQSYKAEQCLRILTDDAITRLALAMEDPTLYGIGKSMFSTGEGLGFNPPELPTPSPTKAKPKDKKTRKKQRGAAKKARKKNR